MCFGVTSRNLAVILGSNKGRHGKKEARRFFSKILKKLTIPPPQKYKSSNLQVPTPPTRTVAVRVSFGIGWIGWRSRTRTLSCRRSPGRALTDRHVGGLP